MTGGKPRPAVIIGGLIAACGVGYYLAPKQALDTIVKHTGFFQTDTSHIISATVESLHAESSILVYSYKGTATVEGDRSLFWIFHGHQRLIVPAVVNYYLPLSNFDQKNVDYDASSKTLRVKLPAITIGDIAFQPENATTINGGTLTFSEAQTEALREMNYLDARRGMIAQAQQPGLLGAARRQAIDDIENYFAIPLKAAGRDDIKVVATFD